MAKTTLILGGGFGGVSTAVHLRKLAPKDHRIVLVDRGGELVIGATKPWVMLGEAQPRDVIHFLNRLPAKGIEVVRSEIRSIDADRKIVETAGGSITGDFLVIALGADYDMDAVPGLKEAAYEYYTLPGAVRLKSALERFEAGKVVHLIPRAPFKCPPAPYEGAFLLHDYFRRKNRAKGMEEAVITIEGAPMATAGPDVGDFIKKELAARNISYRTLARTSRVDPVAKAIHFEDGSTSTYDLLIAVPPHRAPKAVLESGLTGPGGWIPADTKTLEVAKRENVFALGDVAVVSLPGRFKPDAPLVLPKAGTLADGAGKTVAQIIASRLSGRSSRAAFNGKGFCYVEMGDMHAMRGDGNFFDMPHPSMERRTPDMQQYQDKKKWIRDWLYEHWLVD